MKTKRNIAASALALAVSSAFAQSESTGGTNSLYQLATLDPVVVTASRYSETRSEASAVVDVISRDDLNASGANNLAEYLDLMPGVSLTRLYGRLGVDAGVDIGYLGDGSSQNVLVLIDGQRINPFDQSSINFLQVPLSSIEQIEVRKASGGVLFGDRAQGGVVNILTRASHAKEASVTAGSFGYKKADTYLGTKNDYFSIAVAGIASDSVGYRDFNNSKQNSGRVGVSKKFLSSSISLGYRTFNERLELPGSLTEEQFFSNPRQAASGFSSVIDSKRVGESLHLNYSHMFLDSTKFSLDIYDSEIEQTSYTIYRDYPSWGRTKRLIENKRRAVQPQLETYFANAGIIFGGEFFTADANTEGDKKVYQKSSAFYIQSAISLKSSVTVDVGLRTQEVESAFQSESTKPRSYAKSRENAYTLGLRKRISDTVFFRGGLFTGFRFANADELYYYNNEVGDPDRYEALSVNPNIEPMRSNEFYTEFSHRIQSFIIGAHWRLLRTRDEIGNSDNCGEVSGILVGCNTNLFDTKRSVLSLFSKFNGYGGVRIQAAVDLIDAEIDSGPNAGQRVPVTPRKVVHFSVARDWAELGTIMVQAHSRDSMVPSLAYAGSTKKIPSRTVFSAGLQSPPIGPFTWSFWIRNLTNKAYYDYAVDSFGFGVYPADGRSVELSAKYSF